MAESDQVSWFVTKAIERYGDRVLARADDLDETGPQAVGRELARLIFGPAEAGLGIPALLAEMVEDPGDERAWCAVDSHIEDVLESDPGLAAAVADALAGYYRSSWSPVTVRLSPSSPSCCGGMTRSWPGLRSSAPSGPGTGTP
jgi:hypothetical protein